MRTSTPREQKGTVTKELSGTEKTLDRYGRVLEEVQRENIALWVRSLAPSCVFTACWTLGLKD